MLKRKRAKRALFSFWEKLGSSKSFLSLWFMISFTRSSRKKLLYYKLKLSASWALKTWLSASEPPFSPFEFLNWSAVEESRSTLANFRLNHSQWSTEFSNSTLKRTLAFCWLLKSHPAIRCTRASLHTSGWFDFIRRAWARKPANSFLGILQLKSL